MSPSCRFIRSNRSGLQAMRSGFTLIEMIVVIAIVTVLMALLVPTLSEARQTARITLCAAGMRSMGPAMVMYSNAYAGQSATTDQGRNATDGNYRHREPNAGFRRSNDGPTDKRTILQAAWLIDGYLGTASVYFCPGQTVFNDNAGFWYS